MDHGEVFVTMFGTTRMRMLFVGCWDSGEQMDHHLGFNLCSEIPSQFLNLGPNLV